MEYLDWLEKLNQESKGRYMEIICPYFENGQCGIYAERFACCRNFPQAGGYCSQNQDCRIVRNKIENNSADSSLACGGCKNICCEKILVPANRKITKEFIARYMNISCEICRKFF